MADNNKRKAATIATAISRKKPKIAIDPDPPSSLLKPLPQPKLRDLLTSPETTFQQVSIQRFPRYISTLPDSLLGIFKLFCPVSLLEEQVIYINICYIQLFGHTKGPRTKYSRQYTWTPIIADEIYLFFGILLYMSIYPEPQLEYYQNINPTTPIYPIVRFIPRNRFQLFYR